VKESERSLDDLKEKHLALMNEADQLENQLGESERNLENNHEQWEKEIIRYRKVLFFLFFKIVFSNKTVFFFPLIGF